MHCSLPQLPTNGFFYGNGSRHGDTARFRCKDGFTIVTDVSNPKSDQLEIEMECGDLGLWSNVQNLLDCTRAYLQVVWCFDADDYGVTVAGLCRKTS